RGLSLLHSFPTRRSSDLAAMPAPADLNRMLLDVSRSTASHRDLPSLLRDLLGVLRGVARFDRLGLVLHDPVRDVMSLHTIAAVQDRKSTRLNSSHVAISY